MKATISFYLRRGGGWSTNYPLDLPYELKKIWGHINSIISRKTKFKYFKLKI